MPQVELSASKGLNQKSGQGFADSDLATISGALDMGAAGTTAAQKGALVHLVNTTAGNFVVKLFTKAQGAVKGQIKIFLVTAGTNALTIDNHDGTDLSTSADAAGNFVICVFDGTNWVAGTSNVA